jgi:hypothetical protein
MNSTDLSGLLWRKSSHSNGQANCVEVATLSGGRTVVFVRDSKAREGPALMFTVRAWRRLAKTVAADARDRLHLTRPTRGAAFQPCRREAG